MSTKRSTNKWKQSYNILTWYM